MVPAISSTDNKLDNDDATAEGECILFADNRHGDQGNQAEERQYRCRRIPDAMLHGIRGNGARCAAAEALELMVRGIGTAL